MASIRPGLRVMVDANILIAGIVWPRWPYEILLHALKGDIKLVLSPYIIAQARNKLRKSFPGSSSRLEQILELLDYELVEEPSEKEIANAAVLVRDPTDLPVALAAINAKVDYLVSEDKDLTVRDKTTEELRRHLKVYISGTFLREVLGWSSNELEVARRRKWQEIETSQGNSVRRYRDQDTV